MFDGFRNSRQITRCLSGATRFSLYKTGPLAFVRVFHRCRTGFRVRKRAVLRTCVSSTLDGGTARRCGRRLGHDRTEKAAVLQGTLREPFLADPKGALISGIGRRAGCEDTYVQLTRNMSCAR